MDIVTTDLRICIKKIIINAIKFFNDSFPFSKASDELQIMLTQL